MPGNAVQLRQVPGEVEDRKSTRLNSSHVSISYAVFCLKKKNDNKKLRNYHCVNLTGTHIETLPHPFLLNVLPSCVFDEYPHVHLHRLADPCDSAMARPH